VLIQDADLEYDPAEYPRLIQPIVEGRADVVYGSRFHGQGAQGLRWAVARRAHRPVCVRRSLGPSPHAPSQPGDRTSAQLLEHKPCHWRWRPRLGRPAWRASVHQPCVRHWAGGT